MNAALLGFLRGLGFTLLTALLAYLGDASHLSGFASTGIASIISMIALAIEHQIASSTGNALFGAVKQAK